MLLFYIQSLNIKIPLPVLLYYSSSRPISVAIKVNKIDGKLCISLDKTNSAYLSMLEMLNSWQMEYEKFQNTENTKKEYDYWRYNYPKVEAERFKQDIDKLQKAKSQQSE